MTFSTRKWEQEVTRIDYVITLLRERLQICKQRNLLNCWVIYEVVSKEQDDDNTGEGLFCLTSGWVNVLFGEITNLQIPTRIKGASKRKRKTMVMFLYKHYKVYKKQQKMSRKFQPSRHSRNEPRNWENVNEMNHKNFKELLRG